VVYLLHFDRPYRHARHYIGFVEGSLLERLARHRRGDGARIIEVINAAGITFTVARVWELGDRTYERKLKERGGAARICPLCRPGSALRRAR